MSERGSFVTEYIHCEECLVAVRGVLLGDGKFLCSTEIPSYWESPEPLPIIAGKIGASYSGGELVDMEHDFGGSLSKRVCHPVRIAVLCDMEGGGVITVEPET